MTKLAPWSLAILLVASSALAGSILPPTPRPDAPPDVEASQTEPNEDGEARFGVWEARRDTRILHGTRRIPLVPGTRFGWIVDHDAPEGSRVAWREELVVSAPPLYTGGAIRLAPNHLVRERASIVRDGAFDASWTLDAWDPAGPAAIDVYVGGQPVAHFDFEFVGVEHP